MSLFHPFLRGVVGEDRHAHSGREGRMERHEDFDRHGRGGNRSRYDLASRYGSAIWDEPWMDMERDLRHMGLRGADWGLFGPVVEHEFGNDGGESGKYTMNVPLGSNIHPEDIKISCKEHCLTIEARKECKSNDGNSRLYQEFVRKFTVPEHVNMKEVKSILTPEGYLHIEAPLPKKALLEGKQEKEIPIRQ